MGRRSYRKNGLNRAWAGSMVTEEDLHRSPIENEFATEQPSNQFEQPFLYNGSEEEENIFFVQTKQVEHSRFSG